MCLYCTLYCCDLLPAVLVGSPNVGKSSIVRAVSSGTPEVNGLTPKKLLKNSKHELEKHPLFNSNDWNNYLSLSVPLLVCKKPLFFLCAYTIRWCTVSVPRIFASLK